MKPIDINEVKDLPGKRLDKDEPFEFKCHENLSCFNLCCRNLNLFLYPYDVLRLRKNLNLSSDVFIDQYVDIVLRPGNFFPEVLLRMSENEQKTCPFLTDEGCSVYPDRPDTCRTFPVEHGMLFQEEKKHPEIVHFFRPPDFCEGQYEKTEMTIKSWAEDQKAETYNQMTARWAETKSLFHKDPWGKEGPYGPKGKMAFMSAYNIDQFRDFIFKSSFLKRYKIKSSVLKKIKRNDIELLKFSFTWIQFFIWGIKSKNISLKK